MDFDEGRGGSEGCEIPQNIETLNDRGVCQIECGAQFSLALTRETGEVWTWGKGDYFRLGHGSDTHVRLPQPVEGESIVSSALTCFFMLGYLKENIQKETHKLTRQLSLFSFHRCLGLVGKKIVHVAVGALHCLAVTDKGEVWAWGDNDHGQQGNSTTVVNRSAT